MIGRFLASRETLNREQHVIQKCNEHPHKLLVISYMSGDDRDHWELKCTECNVQYVCSLPYDEPYLNYCPYCSSKDEIENANEDYIHYLFGEENLAYLTCDAAEDTPKYIR